MHVKRKFEYKEIYHPLAHDRASGSRVLYRAMWDVKRVRRERPERKMFGGGPRTSRVSAAPGCPCPGVDRAGGPAVSVTARRRVDRQSDAA